MPPRPRTVTYAAWLLYALATLPVAFVLIAVVLRDDLDKAAGPAGAVNPVSLVPLSLIGVTLIVVLAVFVGRGRNWARILVWILAGLNVLNILTTARFLARGSYSAHKPPWYAPVQLTDFAIMFVGLVTVSILLATPSARPFFRGTVSSPAEPAIDPSPR